MGKGVRVGARLDVIEHSPENSPLVPLVCKDLARSSDDQRAHRPAQDVAIFPLSPPHPLCRDGSRMQAAVGAERLPRSPAPHQPCTTSCCCVPHTAWCCRQNSGPHPGRACTTDVHCVPCVCLSTRGGKWSKFPSPQGGGAGLSRDHPAALRPGDPSMSPALTYGDLKGDWLVSVFPVNHRGLQEGSK